MLPQAEAIGRLWTEALDKPISDNCQKGKSVTHEKNGRAARKEVENWRSRMFRNDKNRMCRSKEWAALSWQEGSHQ